MTHPAAVAWDREHRNPYVNPSPHFTRPGVDGAPVWRPCDRCGTPVDEGYVHESCVTQELEELLGRTLFSPDEVRQPGRSTFGRLTTAHEAGHRLSAQRSDNS